MKAVIPSISFPIILSEAKNLVMLKVGFMKGKNLAQDKSG
jgi:hypothetical protein